MKKLFFLFVTALFVFGTNVYAQRILLSQGFENGPYTVDSLPLRWAKVKVIPSTCTGSIADWRVRDSGKAFCGTNPVPSFTTKAYGNTRRSLSIPWTAGNSSLCDDWVFTDSLRIATGDSLIFWVQLGTWPAGGIYYLDSLQIWVCSGQTPASQIAKIATVVSLPAPINTWQQKIYNLNAYNGQRIYVAFRYYMNVVIDGIMVNIDSVMVRNLSGPPVAIKNNKGLVPSRFDLKQNFPNPFNPSTSISFDMPKNEFVNITVYNSVGQEVTVLVNEVKEAGSHNVIFDATNMPSSVYLYRMRAGDFTKSVKMSLIK